MADISREICFKLKEARRAAKISQCELAVEIGCKQSAISMFEQGYPTKLSAETVEKLAKKFEIDLKAEMEKPAVFTAGTGQAVDLVKVGSGFCANPACPTNHRYEVEGRVLFRPDRGAADPVGGRFCAMCGEVLARRCPNCGSPVHEGAICSYCGEPYVVG